MSLIDLLAYEMGCTYISDLKGAAAQGDRLWLLHAITNTRAEEHPLREWNDMLDYLFSAPAEATVKEAKMKALSLLAPARPAPAAGRGGPGGFAGLNGRRSSNIRKMRRSFK